MINNALLAPSSTLSAGLTSTSPLSSSSSSSITLANHQTSANFNQTFKQQQFNNSNASFNTKQQTNEVQPECCGCSGLINDRYFLVVMNRAWHIQCLRCSECKSCLDTQNSCFTKDGQIFCKDDYFK